MVRETGIQSQVESYQKTQKIVLDTTLLSTQNYKVRIKGKVEQSRKLRSVLPYTTVWLQLKREPSGQPQLRLILDGDRNTNEYSGSYWK